MRRSTAMSPNMRTCVRSTPRTLSAATAVLAAGEAHILFWLVKLSGNEAPDGSS